MALERIRKTEKMVASLDAYNSEFPLTDKQYDIYTDPYMPNPDEQALAQEFAKEIYELGEKISELQDRYRTIKEWQYRYYTRYPHANIPIYKPPPKKERKPKITKPPAYGFQSLGGTVYMDEIPIGEVVLSAKELAKGNYSIEKDYAEVTTFGSPNPEYLYSGNTLKLDGKPIGTVSQFEQTVDGSMKITAKITDQAVYDHITKGYQFKASGSKSLTVEDVQKSYDQIKKTMSGSISQKGDYDTLKAMLDAKIKTGLLQGANGKIVAASTPNGSDWATGKKWEFKNLPPLKDGLFKKKSGK